MLECKENDDGFSATATKAPGSCCELPRRRQRSPLKRARALPRRVATAGQERARSQAGPCPQTYPSRARRRWRRRRCRCTRSPLPTLATQTLPYACLTLPGCARRRWRRRRCWCTRGPSPTSRPATPAWSPTASRSSWSAPTASWSPRRARPAAPPRAAAPPPGGGSARILLIRSEMYAYGCSRKDTFCQSLSRVRPRARYQWTLLVCIQGRAPCNSSSLQGASADAARLRAPGGLRRGHRHGEVHEHQVPVQRPDAQRGRHRGHRRAPRPARSFLYRMLLCVAPGAGRRTAALGCGRVPLQHLAAAAGRCARDCRGAPGRWLAARANAPG